MKLLSPRLWSIAWRVRLGLLIVPCVLVLVAWYQFRVANETIERYRVQCGGHQPVDDRGHANAAKRAGDGKCRAWLEFVDARQCFPCR